MVAAGGDQQQRSTDYASRRTLPRRRVFARWEFCLLRLCRAPIATTRVKIYRLPVLGIGAVATRIDGTDGPPSLSHDKKRLAFIRYDRPNQTDQLIVANADVSGEQIISTRKWPAQFGWGFLTKPEWTDDDKSLLLPAITSDSGPAIMVSRQTTRSRSLKRISLTGAEQNHSACSTEIRRGGPSLRCFPTAAA